MHTRPMTPAEKAKYKTGIIIIGWGQKPLPPPSGNAAGEDRSSSTGWDAWWSGLKAIAGEINYPYVYDGNEDCWREYHRNDYSPAEALEEDISYLD